MSGTSMASPNTAGVAAEVMANYPELTPVQVKKALMDSVNLVDSFEGRLVSPGRVDLSKALSKASEL
jgi:subtilisin family serine protease